MGAFQLYANANIGTLFNGNITTNANLGAFQTYANANIGTLFNGNTSTNANLGAFQTYANANIGTLFNGNVSTNANLGAFQRYANANIGTLFNGNVSTNANLGAFQIYANTNILAIQANLGAYQIYANANIGTLFNGNVSTNANLGAFQTYANTKIGTNTNSNLVVVSTAAAISTTEAALIVRGGAGVAGNTVIGGNVTVGQTTSSNRANLFVFGGNLASAAGSALRLAEFSTTNTNTSYLQISTQRFSQGADWTTANVKLQQIVDADGMGYIDFNPAGNLRAISIGSTNGEIIRFHNSYAGGERAITHTGNILPSANLTYNIGSPTAWYDTFYGVSSQALYADLAEMYVGDAEYPAGTVVVIGGEEEITVTTQDHDTRVAGVISTDPAYLMNSGNSGSPVALTGRVPCRVQGPVSKGALLVTSCTAGVAQVINPAKYQPGCVIGKSLQNIIDNDIHVIEIMVGRF